MSTPLPTEPTRLLIIDDNPAIHDDIRKILSGPSRADLAFREARDRLFGQATQHPRPLNFEIDSAYQGREGLEKVEAAMAAGESYALAFVDVRMPPGWDGIETTLHLLKMSPELQIVICTAYSDYSWEDISLKLGESDNLMILKKPFDNIEVLQLVHTMTEKWRLSRALKDQLANLDRLVQVRTRALEESLARNQALIRANPDLIFTNHRDGVFLDVQVPDPKLLYASPESFLHRNIQEVLPRPLGDQFIQVFSEALDSNSMQKLSYSLRVEGGEKHFEARVAPSTSDTVITIVRDISDLKNAEETRLRLQSQLQHSQKLESLGSLAGGVAHDFNNMLNGIMGFTDLLCLAETDPVRLKYLDGIKRATARSADLTQKLLAFGRRGKNLVEPVNLQQAVEECLGMLKPSMNSNLSVAVDFQGPCWISGDPSQIQQVLVNLCINAMEAMQEGGRLTLTCRPRALGPKEGVGVGVGVGLPEGQYLELKVSDEGTGMPEEVLERIFEPFFTTKNDGRTIGSGLGLSTVYGIVMAHNGDISVESELGRGTRFRLLFPATAVSAMLGPASAPGARSLQSTEPATGKILMVEDESILLELGERALETLGYTPLTARNGLEGVETFRQHHADLRMVLLDLKMPDMGGHEAFINMHLIDPAVPVIICTGYGDNEEVHHLIGLGAKNMLSKPYTIAGLADALTLNARVLATTNRTGGAT